MRFSMALAALIGSATSTILWDGRFNDESISDLNKWSWSNQVGKYQYYIHGSGAIGSYLALDSSYKNPADSGSASGLKLTLDSTSYWNGQNMRRTELIPQTTAAINSGKVYYHFSIMHTATNAPSIYREHQICFFESHFTELKSGWISGESGTSDPLLRWDISGNSHWSTNWTAGVWHNVAYGIDFSAGSVEFYHSTGSDPLTLTVPAVSVSASSNGADWHLGVLELPVGGQADATEDYYFSGVYIESGSLTTNVAGPGGAVPSSSSSATTSVDSSSPSSSSVISSVVSSSSAAVVVEPASSTVEASSVTSAASSAIVQSPSVVSSAVQAVSTSSALSISSASVAPAASSAPVIIASSSSKKSCTKKAASSTAVAVASTKKPCTKAASATATASAISSFVTSKKKCSSVSSSSAVFSAPNVAIVSSATAALTSATGSTPHTTVTKTTTITTQTTVSSSSASATSTGSAGTIAKWGQCGGQNWSGSGSCVSGTTCTVSNPYYSQCL